MKIAFNDSTKMCTLSNEEKFDFESDYINNYIKNSASLAANKAWKNSGYGARFRGEVDKASSFDENIEAYINSINFVNDTNLVYTFTINDVSGVYKKNLLLTKESESHLIHSRDVEFLSSVYNAPSDNLLFTLKKDAVTSQIATMKLSNGDYHTLTSGDCKDENPSFASNKENTVLYNSYGVGRDYSGNFIEYGDSVINSINLATSNIEEVKAESGYSLIKPKTDSKGNLYYIKKPTKIKKKGNLFLDILLIPVKIVVAIYRFLETFVLLFTGKTFTSKDENPTKERKMNSAQIYIDGNLINADKEFKQNQKNADKIVGIVPSSWQLVRTTLSGNQETIRNGITDFTISEDDEIICSDGKNIIKITETLSDKKSSFKAEKLASAKLCTCLSALNSPSSKAVINDIFNI